MAREKKAIKIATLDIETDPFKQGRFPRPFAVDLFDGTNHVTFWGDGCMERMRLHLEAHEPLLIFAHNGGRFDLFYCMDWIAGNPMRVVSSRIIKSKMQAKNGWHEIRDSYAIMPFALGSYKGGNKQKLHIDIAKLEADVRETHKQEITTYLHGDTETLHELCTAFVAKFGPQLTIGSTAMKELAKIHDFDRLDKITDADIRSKYYYGGRVECFESGILHGDFKVFDVNSMYPFVMKSALHPIGTPTSETDYITEDTCFISVEGINHGAFPVRDKTGIHFNCKCGTFHVSIHEYNTAIELGLFETKNIFRCINFEQRGTFATFVDTYYGARLAAKKIGDAVNEMFYKIILNSSYGKFGQNPDNYVENIICQAGWDNAPGELCRCKPIVIDGEVIECSCGNWTIQEIVNLSEKADQNYWVWKRPTSDVSRFNVATGASITGASRAILMRAIATAKRTVYCDTDCVICEGLESVAVDGKQLGAWKLEAEGNCMAIAGKKLYTLLDSDSTRNLERIESGKKYEIVSDGRLAVKKANKGVMVTAAEILAVAGGAEVKSHRAAPSFKLDGSVQFISRTVRRTTK